MSKKIKDKPNKTGVASGLVTLRETPKCDRPREKILKRGVKSLSNTELVAALLTTGLRGLDVYQIAEGIVDTMEENFDDLSVELLEKVNGVGKARACRIMASIELSRRFLIKEGIAVRNDRDVLNLVMDLAHKKQEYFLSLTLDGDHKLIRKQTLFVGTLNQSLIHPREIFAEALKDRAAGIILVHNHPSGNSEPSKADNIITDRIMEAGKIMGIEILDHIIVGKNNYYSFKKSGYLEKKIIRSQCVPVEISNG